MYKFLRPLLFLLPAETAHHAGMAMLALLGRFAAVCRWLRRRALRPLSRTSSSGHRPEPSLEVRFAGLRFEHPIGLAAGMDKNGVALQALFGLGFAAIEMGTVTPRAQPGNPLPRLFRLPASRALINRLGFNNEGAAAAARAIQRQPWRPGPLGVNIGKNKDTPLDAATTDYVACVDQLAALGDYVVLNASSPNTPGLRSLQEPEQLAALLSAVQERLRSVAPGKPLFLKFAPDLSDEAIDTLVDVAVEHRIAGLIATNTTLERPVTGEHAAEAGGLSGAPLRNLSTRALGRAYERAQGRLALIGVGGIFSAEDVYEKIRAGASIVQLYTGFIYQGPAVIPELLSGLQELLRRDGFENLADAKGVDAARPTSRPSPLAGHAPVG